jgi:hypothetical protein
MAGGAYRIGIINPGICVANGMVGICIVFNYFTGGPIDLGNQEIV